MWDQIGLISKCQIFEAGPAVSQGLGFLRICGQVTPIFTL